MTGRGVKVERFELDVARGRLGIAGFRLADREPGPPLAEFERLDLRFRPRALLRGHVHVTEAALTAPRVRIVRRATGELNVADLLGQRQASERVAAVTVDRFTLAGGMVTLEDHTRTPPRTWQIEAIGAEASGLSTVRPEMTGSGRLTATVAGGPVSADLSELRLVPIHARARAAVQGVDATLPGMFLPPDAPLLIERARVSTTLASLLDAADGVRVDGQGRLEDVVLRRRKPLLRSRGPAPRLRRAGRGRTGHRALAGPPGDQRHRHDVRRTRRHPDPVRDRPAAAARRRQLRTRAPRPA